ncbi:hypothetical protein PROFUN_05305 [Planoprotostelium fungivorum]|uniref:Uncharacterized protein n=1 Tax=Planoprotostelium fungivorum TaxID=1890364 RepID=A0A2P6NRD5_9EUKA|nr:hypothetical protein PROFUN_05305 [Planoprotostelium fungivorum]
MRYHLVTKISKGRTPSIPSRVNSTAEPRSSTVIGLSLDLNNPVGQGTTSGHFSIFPVPYEKLEVQSCTCNELILNFERRILSGIWKPGRRFEEDYDRSLRPIEILWMQGAPDSHHTTASGFSPFGRNIAEFPESESASHSDFSRPLNPQFHR